MIDMSYTSAQSSVMGIPDGRTTSERYVGGNRWRYRHGMYRWTLGGKREDCQ